jgi:hypothetical protein
MGDRALDQLTRFELDHAGNAPVGQIARGSLAGEVHADCGAHDPYAPLDHIDGVLSV